MKAIDRENLIQALQSQDNGTGVFTRKQIIETASSIGLGFPAWLVNGKPEVKVDRGVYNLTSMFGGQVAQAQPIEQAQQAPLAVVETQAPQVLVQAKLAVEVDDLIPGKDATFVPFGFYKDLKTVLSTSMFYPIFISGLSGNGKTTMVEQVCANLKREAIRVNISIETDEDDLIGGNTLVDGNVVYREGPVLTAMKRGAVLILDEVDRGSNKLMCLQAILEGKPYFNKKTGETVTPAPGFNLVATANTKGRGSDDGKFISANILDEAFLERFAITVEQEYPTMATEKKIIVKKMEKVNNVDQDFATHLVTWSDVIRKTYYEGAIDELISTRRLEHIVNAFAVFGDKQKAVQLCVNRFDEDTKEAFIDLYAKVDPTVELEQQMEENAEQEIHEDGES
jgi:midasin (ATPase involved in ribosome maturation)